MKIRILAGIVSALLMCGIVNAEQTSQDNVGEITVSRNPGGIIISYVYKNRTLATYTRYSHPGRTFDRLRIDDFRNVYGVDIQVKRSGEIKSARVDGYHYPCENLDNKVLCDLAQKTTDAWRVKLDVENNIRKGIDMPIFDFEPYMPPHH